MLINLICFKSKNKIFFLCLIQETDTPTNDIVGVIEAIQFNEIEAELMVDHEENIMDLKASIPLLKSTFDIENESEMVDKLPVKVNLKIQGDTVLSLSYCENEAHRIAKQNSKTKKKASH